MIPSVLGIIGAEDASLRAGESMTQGGGWSMEIQAARERARRELEVTRGNLARAERRKAPERDLEALRSKVDFWETVCAEIGAGSDVEE